MKKVMKILGVILFASAILTSCGSSGGDASGGQAPVVIESNPHQESSGGSIGNPNQDPLKNTTTDKQESKPQEEEGTNNEEPAKITVCECENLVFEYLEKKSQAQTEEEKIQLAKEELEKNVQCYELEKSLGDKLKEEQDKCH